MSEITHRTHRFASHYHLRGNVAYVAFEGELDMQAVGLASDGLRDVLADEPDTLVLDLAEVRFLDSLGLALLVRTKREVESRSKQMYVSRHSKASKRLVEICDLAPWFAPTDAFGAALIPCPICDDLISPSSRQCDHCGSAL